MKRGCSGTYQVSTFAGETVNAFVPNVLPPSPPLELSASRQRQLERSTLALGRLDSITLLLPDPHLFLYSYIRREAVLSSQIEGTQSSLADLLLFEIDEAPGVPMDDVAEVSAYVAAMEHGIDRLREGFPLSNRLIREMHQAMLSKGRGSERSPGEFRRSQNWIGGTRPGTAHFVPPPPEHVEECMASLEKFIHDDTSSYPTLLKAALAHVQFETIHPFLDGNGRVGRLLIAFVLHHGQVLTNPLLYLSLFFKKNRAEYYQLLDQVRSDGDWEAWVDFFLRGVEETAAGAVQTAQQLVKLFKDDGARVGAAKPQSASSIRVFTAMCERPIASLRDLQARTGLSFPTASKGMTRLAELGVVKEVTGNRRNRVFAYGRYLSILNEGTEPLPR